MNDDRDNCFASRRPPLFARLLLPLLVLAVGIVLAIWLLETRPQAKPRPQERSALLVEVRPVEFSRQPTRVEAMGTVQAARLVELRPQVGGKVSELGKNLIPGGIVNEGELLLRLDPADYLLAVRQQAGEVARVESELRLEQGNQLVARKEYELLGEQVSEEELALMLRRPQLESLQASLASAQARLEQARLDLARTEITAPFNAVVQSRGVEVGTRVGEGTTLATLAGTDEFWVEVAVPVHQLRWISIPGGHSAVGSTVRIRDEAAWGRDAFRNGRVIRLGASLEENGRMARLLVRVGDPLCLRPEHADSPRMLLGAYVRVTIEGAPLASAAAIDRQFIRDGENVWIMDADNRLAIRPVEIAFRGATEVLVTGGIEPGDRLIVSDLPAPVEGMPLRLREEAAAGNDRQPKEKP